MADYTKMISWIKKWEGGLSKAKTDSASSYPVPDGSGYHTNKGVTWKSFEALAPKLGYTATPALFYKMPDDIWGRIFKVGYWDPINGDNIKSQAIAETLADWAWGAGPGTAIKKLKEFLGLPSSYTMDAATLAKVNAPAPNEKDFLKRLSDYKLKWYTSLPGQSANYSGWTNRLNDLYKTTLGKVGTGTITGIFFLVAVGVVVWQWDNIKKLI